MSDVFWSKVDIRLPAECWEWQACRSRKGYGRFHLGSRVVQAHRVAHALTIGPVPLDVLVCHTCDNPPCCNPLHLFLGTNTDNARDRETKRRSVLPHGYTNLTEEERVEIRRLYAAGGISQMALAREFGVAQSTISLISRAGVIAA